MIGGLKQIITKQQIKKSQVEKPKEVIRYFENHRDWMKYDQYLRAGYPIGTGVVESTCGHTVKKLHGRYRAPMVDRRSDIATWMNRQFPGWDFHPLETQHYGLRAYKKSYTHI